VTTFKGNEVTFLAHRHAALVEANRRRRTVLDTINEELNLARLDAYLDAVACFPAELPRLANGRPNWDALPIEAIRVRRWGDRRTKISALNPDLVTSAREVFPRMMRVAYEIEDPWEAYTAESVAYMDNDGVRKLSTFMEAIWQNDERRHASVFKSAYLAITGDRDLPPNPHEVWPVLPGTAALEAHIYARLNAEMSASSSYAVFASHAKDDLADMITNVAGDEFRHLAIFWAATKWRFGERAYQRLGRLLNQLRLSAAGHRKLRSDVNEVGVGDLVVMGEVVLAMTAEIKLLLAWDKTLTPSRLNEVFGSLPATALV
jgi:hypothetical protein